MKIAFVVDSVFPDNTAGSLRVEETAKYLSKKNEVFVLCRGKSKDFSGAKIVPLYKSSKKLGFLLFPFSARRQLKKIKPDVIVVTSPPLNSLFLTLFFKNVVADIRDLSFCLGAKLSPYPFSYRLVGKVFEKYLISRAKKIVVVAPVFKKYFSDAVQITNGVDLEKFKIMNSNVKKELGIEGKNLILYSGSLSEYHLPDFLLRVVGDVTEIKKNTVFLFVGGGNRIDYFKKQAEKRGLLGHIIIIERLPQEKLVDYINGSDVCLSTMDPQYHSVPLKIFEQLACNKPVVTNIPDYKDMFGAGVYVGTTETDFAKKILNLLQNKPIINSRKMIEEKYTRKKLAEEYEKLLEKLLGGLR